MAEISSGLDCVCHTGSYIGFPDATPEDYIAITELIDDLKSEGFIGWTFPLLLIPMGGEKEGSWFFIFEFIA